VILNEQRTCDNVMMCTKEICDGIKFCLKYGDDEVTDCKEQAGRGGGRQCCSLCTHLFSIFIDDVLDLGSPNYARAGHARYPARHSLF
jgi:hypothetical protein